MIKNWALKPGILLFVFVGFFGCASLPRPDEMKDEVANYQLPKLPEDGKAIVYVVRPSSFGGKEFSFKVFLDNQDAKSEVGSTMGKQYIYFNLAPGEHKILSKADNWAETIASAKAGDIIFIQQEPYMGAVTFKNRLLHLKDYEGKYLVKTLSLGTIPTSTVPTQARLEQRSNTGRTWPQSNMLTGAGPSHFKTMEVKYFTQKEGVGLSQQFLNYFYQGLCQQLVKVGIASQVVNEGSSLPEADTDDAVILEGKIIEYKDAWYGILLKSEIKLYRRSGNTLIKTITSQVGAKASPFNTDKNVGENTGKRTADEIKKAMK